MFSQADLRNILSPLTGYLQSKQWYRKYITAKAKILNVPSIARQLCTSMTIQPNVKPTYSTDHRMIFIFNDGQPLCNSNRGDDQDESNGDFLKSNPKRQGACKGKAYPIYTMTAYGQSIFPGVVSINAFNQDRL